ncbi:MAG TPA: hypothetical protein VHD63_17390 [Ktedonobacteraceae bacterium]|nr:hypothetical protein [Ktedonobacteraceae bacterium]
MFTLRSFAFTGMRMATSHHVVLVLGTVAGFFNTLNRDVIGFALAEAAFAFAFAAAFYIIGGITGNERAHQHALQALYAALAGLALATLSNTITTLVSHAASGQ